MVSMVSMFQRFLNETAFTNSAAISWVLAIWMQRGASNRSTNSRESSGQLMQAMLAPSFEALESAIEHNDHEKFEKALTQTIDTCNACHAVTGSDFVQVTLDAREALSIRHPHKFMEREVPGGHTHGMPSGIGF